MVYLVDSAGARITDQVQMFPGRRGAGRIFYNEVRCPGVVPQVCVLFGPSAAGGAYIPAFCDVVIMREGNASMYLGSPRMAEMVIGEKVTLEEMGGARMHTSVSGCGHFLVGTRRGGHRPGAALPRRYFPSNWREQPPPAPPRRAGARRRRIAEHRARPTRTSRSTCRQLIDALVDEGSWLEVQPRWAQGAGRRLRAPRRAASSAIVANQPKVKGGVLFVDSADKAARFIWTCNAFNIPLLFLADVPGFMIGTKVEREGIIRHGAKMISACREATVPKISVVVRKGYGAGLYAMAGPAFEPDCCLALPTRADRRDGPAGGDQRRLLQPDPGDRGPRGARARAPRSCGSEYAEDIDILHLASRAGRRRRDRARGAARRARAPVRARAAASAASGRRGATPSRRSPERGARSGRVVRRRRRPEVAEVRRRVRLARHGLRGGPAGRRWRSRGAGGTGSSAGRSSSTVNDGQSSVSSR